MRVVVRLERGEELGRPPLAVVARDGNDVAGSVGADALVQPPVQVQAREETSFAPGAAPSIRPPNRPLAAVMPAHAQSDAYPNRVIRVIVGFAAGVPAWVFTLYGGVIADRIPRRTLLLVTQTVMMALGMVVIASMIGARGIGETVLLGLQRNDSGAGLVGGLGIVGLAILFDRLLQSFGGSAAVSPKRRA